MFPQNLNHICFTFTQPPTYVATAKWIIAYVCSGKAAGMYVGEDIGSKWRMHAKAPKRVVYKASPLVNSMCVLGKLSACSCVLVFIDSMYACMFIY